MKHPQLGLGLNEPKDSEKQGQIPAEIWENILGDRKTIKTIRDNMKTGLPNVYYHSTRAAWHDDETNYSTTH